MPDDVDRLGYVTGYGASLMVSWLLSTLIGINVAALFVSFDLGSVSFAGPLVMATMMMLFAKGSKSSPVPWVISGVTSLFLFELGAANYLILLVSVTSGVIATIFQTQRING